MLVKTFDAKRLEKNADGSQRKIPLFVAVAKSGFVTSELINILHDKGADINARDDGGLTPLHYIAKKMQPVQKFDSMLKAGANPDAVVGRGRFSRSKKPIDFVKGSDSANTKKYKEAVRGVIEEYKAAEAAKKTAEKNEQSEGGERPKKGFSIFKVVSKTAEGVRGKRASQGGYQRVYATEDPSAGAQASAAGPARATAPNPELQPTDKSTEKTRLLDGGNAENTSYL